MKHLRSKDVDRHRAAEVCLEFRFERRERDGRSHKTFCTEKYHTTPLNNRQTGNIYEQAL